MQPDRVPSAAAAPQTGTWSRAAETEGAPEPRGSHGLTTAESCARLAQFGPTRCRKPSNGWRGALAKAMPFDLPRKM